MCFISLMHVCWDLNLPLGCGPGLNKELLYCTEQLWISSPRHKMDAGRVAELPAAPNMTKEDGWSANAHLEQKKMTWCTAWRGQNNSHAPVHEIQISNFLTSPTQWWMKADPSPATRTNLTSITWECKWLCSNCYAKPSSLSLYI